jgi:PTH1 family peptidyl-tRNA hydrolase
MVIDHVARKHGILFSKRRFRARYGEGTICSEQVVLIKPFTYMNRSGLPIKLFLDAYDSSPRELILVHDDLDLDFGSIRIKKRGGHGGHKGVQSVIESMGSSDFVRLKVGIGHPRGALDVTDHVLHHFEKEERAQLAKILSRAVEAMEAILTEGVDRAMNAFNTSVACGNEGN